MEHNLQVLLDAYHAWMRCASLRNSRARNKRFTYGDQWSDAYTDRDGDTLTDGQRCILSGTRPLTNNLLRQLVRTVVGRYRSQVIDATVPADKHLVQECLRLHLDELDSRALEEFLISGCVCQRVEQVTRLGMTSTEVDNVNLNQFFIDSIMDPRGKDCHLVGQLHDLTMAELLQRVAGGSRRRAQWVRRLYCEQADRRIADLTTSIGADAMTGIDFWHVHGARCRAIEVWTLESREVVVCHNRRTAQLTVVPLTQPREVKHMRQDPDVSTRWDVETRWRCRWFSPMGDVLLQNDAPPHGHHPFVTKFYPLIDGEVHSFVEGAIDQQKQVNRLITMVNHVMECSAKGVLLFPETSLPDGFTWADVRRAWSNAGGILPYDPRESDARPEQIVTNTSGAGAYEMIDLQMRLLEQVSGVSGAMQGHSGESGNSASLYETQSQNAVIALTDLFDTFTAFRDARNRLMRKQSDCRNIAS